MRAAVFLDRDGVLVEDVGLLVRWEAFQLLPGVPEALRRLHDSGFALVVVSNQAVVARGLATETEVTALNAKLQEQLEARGGPRLDGWYFCPHHPNATVPLYRVACECRKPAPGLLRRAAHELELNLPSSFLVGDRLTDVQTGASAGCRTVLVQTGKHGDPAIETVEPLDPDVCPDHVCPNLPAAADWILHRG